jgi:choline dehydrogenase-like flavoprotein
VFQDAQSIPADSVLDSDLCIVGCGAAGITIARELAGSSLRVTVLESGGLDFDAPTSDLYVGDITGLPYFELQFARLRYFGGSTNHWGGTCRPEEPIDFEVRDWVPHSGWPISRADLDPYYPRAAEVVGLNVAERDLDVWRAASPFPTMPFDEERIVTVVAQIVKSRERRFAPRYRSELESAANINVVLHANATEIETNGAGGAVDRIHAATLAGGRFTVTAGAYIVATGGIENARLLLASDRVRPNGVGNDHDLVGRFFLEHPRFDAGMILPTDKRIPIGFYQPHDVPGSTILGYLSLSEEVARAERLVDVQARLTPIYDPAVQAALDSRAVTSLRGLADAVRGSGVDRFGEDLVRVAGDLMTWQQAIIGGGPIPVPLPEAVEELMRQAGEDDVESILPLLVGDIATAGYGELAGTFPVTGISVSTRIESTPNPDSRVRLGTERDALGMRRVELDWQLTELDKHSVIRMMELLASEFGRTGLGRVRVDVEEGADSWPADLEGGWHHMGTTRMSDDPTRGVVDRDGRVHGVDNLYVAGSSVFATAGSGTPTMTIVALALRLADHLRDRLT